MRMFSFILINIAIMITISIITIPFHGWMNASGIAYSKLAMYCMVWGFAGAFISLMLSKFMAKMTMGVEIIDGNENNDTRWLVATVADLAKTAGIGMPEVGIFDGAPNAFATGPNRNNALVAVSTGLLRSMNQSQIRAVLAHEVAHIANGDMVSMTLAQGTMNAFGMFISRIIAATIGRDSNGNTTWVYYVSVLVFDIILSLLGSMILAWFSRQREYRADWGAAEMMGEARSMQNALNALHNTTSLPSSMAALGIASGDVARLFATHPSIEERIEALNQF